MSFELDETQVEAIEFAVGRSFAIITGGAGTGKTTIIKEIATRFKAKKKRVEVCAPTGKAAARLKEATGFDAYTIHKMLGYRGDIFARETLQGTTVIVDEASMVSSDLMAQIMKRDPACIILVGDEAQLLPVGSGQPFHDLIKHLPDSKINLTKCFRNTEAVFKAATAIREGVMPEMIDESESERWEIFKTGTPEETQRQLLGYIKNGSIDFDQDIILCPKNGKTEDDCCTVKGLNKAIVDIVNPRDDDETKFMINDRVINTKNHSDKDVWNGTTGAIHAIDSSGDIWVKLDVPIVDQEETTDLNAPIYKDKVLFGKDMRKTLQLAYALTCHKAQGSQYRKVVVCVLERDSFSLTRSWIYTAVTRTKKHCIVAGQIRALANGIKKVTEKRTVLQELAK